MNKKGAQWIAWILATALFVSLSVMGIIWARNQTTTLTESTAEYIEAREECKMVLVNANNDCSELKAENKGTITIKKFIVRINRATGYEDGGETAEFKPQQGLLPLLPIGLSIPADTKSVELLPIIEISKGKLASCTTKRLVIQCA